MLIPQNNGSMEKSILDEEAEEIFQKICIYFQNLSIHKKVDELRIFYKTEYDKAIFMIRTATGYHQDVIIYNNIHDVISIVKEKCHSNGFDIKEELDGRDMPMWRVKRNYSSHTTAAIFGN